MPDIVAFPTSWYGAVSSRFYLSSASQSATSPWSGRRSVYGPHRQFWRCEVQLPIMQEARWRAISAFFSETAGQSGLIRIGDMKRRLPLYNLQAQLSEQPFSDDTFFDDGTGWIEGGLPALLHVLEAAPRGARSVVVGGLGADLARSLQRGDLIEFRRDGIASEIPSLHEVRRDAPTDASGETRLELNVPLRAGLQPGDQVVTQDAMSVFRCIDDEQGIVDRDAAYLGATGFTLIENII